jgi:tetratricopeptide (TPR) repeat protein
MDLKDSTQALDDFVAALNVYNQAPAPGAKPKEADKSMATVYGQAILLRKAKKEYEQAMALLAEAQQKFPNNADLKRYEIVLFQNPSPEFFETAVARFEKLTTENPNDTTSLLVYATLLEKKDADKAIATYKKLLELQPNNLTAIFNVGALYNNKAKDVTDQYNNLIAAKSKDNAQLEALERKIDDSFRAALPYFEKAHQLEPENETVLTVLIQITGNLKMMESTEQYIAKRKALRGY